MTDNYRKITEMEFGAKMERERIIKLLEKFEAFGRDVITSEYITTEELTAIITKERNE